MIGAWVRALRPRQWTKNLLVFAGVLFSRNLTTPDLVLRATAGFAAFCLLASASYLLNDIRDRESDRLHPRKRSRPIASGELPIAVAALSVPVLIGGAVALTVWLGPAFAWVALAYLALNFLYTIWFKRQVLLDVFSISIGFVLRAIAGVELLTPLAPDTQLSPWLLVCTFFGALFLALAKRRRELVSAGLQASRQRAVLDHYTPELLDGFLMVSASASMMGYALYTIWPATVAKFGTEALLTTVPFVAYGIFRYLYLVRISERTEDPSQVLLTDAPLGVCVVLYLLVVLVILYR